jgi:hypothetical protein
MAESWLFVSCKKQRRQHFKVEKSIPNVTDLKKESYQNVQNAQTLRAFQLCGIFDKS